MPSERWIKGMTIAGSLAGAMVIAGGIALVSRFSYPAIWSLPFLVTYGAGLYACRAEPQNLAARRLLLFGTVGLAWLAGSEALLLVFDAEGSGNWLVPANAAVQIAGLLMVTTIVALLAVYPDGIPTRAAERRIPVVLGIVSVAVPVLLLLSAEQIAPAWILEWAAEGPFKAAVFDNPFQLGSFSAIDGALRFFMDSALGLVPLIGVVLATLRYRTFPPEKRLQMKWPFYSVLLLLLSPVCDLLVSAGALSMATGDAFEVGTLILLPAALAIGIARPRLFDLEHAARRSLIYAVLWVLIVGAYAGLAAALGITVGGDNLQIAVAVAIVGTLVFDPVRRALSRRATRYVYGERIGGEELMRRLGATLEHTLDSDQLVAATAATAREGIGARWVRITLSSGDAPVVDGQAPGPGERPELTAPLAHGGEEIGTIECGPSASGRDYDNEGELLATLARQTALAIINARLAEELGQRLEELAASRSRIVEAEERGRRRIERDIHDGSQQELAALIARIALARNQLRRGDPTTIANALADLQSEAGQALENLRELASGIHPSVLSDRGLVEAIEARAARLPLGVTIECDPTLRDARLDESVEGAVYFFVCEGFANTLKHAGAERVVVRITRPDGLLCVEVSDNGAGFDQEEIERSGGLAGLADRLAAIGGELEVVSRVGQGTLLRATVPTARVIHA